ncbi:MAG: DUF2914 domain-containing protein [Bdellovibrionales bacterium]
MVDFVKEKHQQAMSFYQKHEHKVPALFFIGGFIFDVITLDRIDSLFSLIQQTVYLIIIGILLVAESYELFNRLQMPPWVQKLLGYREMAVHFLFGSLLSTYTLFFLKSSSLFTSFVFVGLIAALLILNELPRFQKYGLMMRFALYALCLTCFFSYLMPILLRHIGLLPFTLSLLASISIISLFVWHLRRRKFDENFIRKEVAMPSVAVLAIFLFLYIFQMIPPVPLSLTDVGVYYSAEKSDGKFKMGYYRDWWRFWQKGAQTFSARPEDKIYFFVSLFSPSHFSDKVQIRWLFKDPKYGWANTDIIPLAISGGRDAGYRGYALKSNYQPGAWQVRVETSDGREIGRLYFDVITDATQEPREVRYDLF